MKIQYNQINTYTIGEFMLLPGLNEVDLALYEGVKTHPAFEDRVKQGVITVLGNEPLSAADIAQLFDVELLRSIVDSETSAAAEKKAAKKQLELIAKADTPPVAE